MFQIQSRERILYSNTRIVPPGGRLSKSVGGLYHYLLQDWVVNTPVPNKLLLDKNLHLASLFDDPQEVVVGALAEYFSHCFAPLRWFAVTR